MSRAEFDTRFPDRAACARYLAAKRWPDGFVCPACGVRRGWELETKPFTWECSGCHRQTSVTAGTVMHRSKLPLRTWFAAIHQLASHSNGISAEQAQAQFGIGSYKTAWLLLHKLRRAMVSPDRSLLQAMVETDETEVPLRSKHDPIKGYGIPNVGKLLIIGAVELSPDGYPRRVRLEPLRDRTGENVRGFVERLVARDATVVSDGGERRSGELPEARGTQARGQDRRQHGGTHPAAVGASGVRQSEALAHRHVPRRAQTAPQALSRRIHLPVEPPAAYPDGVRQPARPGHPPAARLPARLRRPAGLNNACHLMPRRTLHAMNMVDRIAHAIAAADGGDFQADPARYRRLALAALQPLASPTVAMIDAAHQAVSFDDAWAINNRSDFKRAVKAMLAASAAKRE